MHLTIHVVSDTQAYIVLALLHTVLLAMQTILPPY